MRTRFQSVISLVGCKDLYYCFLLIQLFISTIIPRRVHPKISAHPSILWNGHLYSIFPNPSVHPFHFLSKTTERIEMKFYMGFGNHKAQRAKQDGVWLMHSYAQKFVFSLFFTYLWLCIYKSGSSQAFKDLGIILILLCIDWPLSICF